MALARNLTLSMRLLARDWRAGELRLFVAAIAIAVGAVTAVGFFNDRVQSGLAQRSADLLGADLILLSPEPVPPAWIDAVEARELKSTAVTEFASVVLHDERLQLASVRAVGVGYPSRGALRSAFNLYAPEAATVGVPAPGSAWVEARALRALGIDAGQTIEVGNARFVVTRVLTYEPGRGGNFFAFAPRVLINREDVARTGAIQPGSRVTYGYGFAGDEPRLRAYRDWLKPRLSTRQRLIDAREGNPAIARAIERAERYIGLSSLLAVVLAGVAIAMGARRYSQRHYDSSAMLRCFGATQRDILELYLPQLLVVGLAASALGCLAGFVAQEVVYLLVQDLFPVKLPIPGLTPALFGFATGLATLAGFGLVPVLRLRAVPPLRVLRRDLAPLPASAWVAVATAAGVMLLLLWRVTASWTLTLAVLAGAAAVALTLLTLALLLLRLGRRLYRHSRTARRHGLSALWRRLHANAGQILAFGLALMAMATIALVRTDLLATWRAQLPDDAPNHFVFNVLPQNVPGVERFFSANGIEAQALYPMVRGRLTAINGAPLTQVVTKEETDNEALQRDLNLTWAMQPPSDNVVVAGEWWDAKPAAGLVSVEEKLAKQLGVGLGDKLSFTIEAGTLEARVTSLRRVRWDSFHPNFFMIFTPGTLDKFPATYMTSFFVTPAQKPLLTTLVRESPNVGVLELDQFLDQVRTVVRQASLAIEFMLLFVLAAGLAVLYAALAASLDERFYEGALLRTFGASRKQLRRAHLAEFLALGALAGILAAIGTEVIAYVLYSRVFDIGYSPKWMVWLLAPAAGAVVIGLAGYFGTRRVVDRSPLSVLREI